jgi:hypothetical protein
MMHTTISYLPGDSMAAAEGGWINYAFVLASLKVLLYTAHLKEDTSFGRRTLI